jgi:hypothetical protein
MMNKKRIMIGLPTNFFLITTPNAYAQNTSTTAGSINNTSPTPLFPAASLSNQIFYL